MWEQQWVVGAASSDDAAGLVQDALRQWTPADTAAPHVAAVRFYQGTDDEALANQYLDEVAEIRDVVAATPREELAQRFGRMQQRALGIPPRRGWVVLAREGPRSPRPLDWTRPAGPRWVAAVQWEGEPPRLAGPDAG